MQLERFEIGKICSDSGGILIGDPGYFLHGESPEIFGHTWDDFCKKNDSDYFRKSFQIKQNSFGATLAVDVRPGGDGLYPVIVEKTEHGLWRLIIEFD